jgi:hypothetical protein
MDFFTPSVRLHALGQIFGSGEKGICDEKSVVIATLMGPYVVPW